MLLIFPPTWSPSATHGLTVTRISVSARPFAEYCQSSQKLVKIAKKKKIDNDFSLDFKSWLQRAESRKSVAEM